MYKFLSLFICYSLCSSLYAQDLDLPFNPEPGKCYAKSLVEISEEDAAPFTEKRSYTIYVGDNEVASKTVYHPVRIDKEGEVIEQIPIEIPKQKNELPVEDLEVVEYDTHHEDRTGAKDVVWREIFCGEKLTPELVQEIADKLSNQGFQVNGVHETITSEVKIAMTNFQRAMNLDVGQLDFETLDALGVEYESM